MPCPAWWLRHTKKQFIALCWQWRQVHGTVKRSRATSLNYNVLVFLPNLKNPNWEFKLYVGQGDNQSNLYLFSFSNNYREEMCPFHLWEGYFPFQRWGRGRFRSELIVPWLIFSLPLLRPARMTCIVHTTGGKRVNQFGEQLVPVFRIYWWL